MGLAEQFDEVKRMYREANLALGDLIKVHLLHLFLALLSLYFQVGKNPANLMSYYDTKTLKCIPVWKVLLDWVARNSGKASKMHLSVRDSLSSLFMKWGGLNFYSHSCAEFSHANLCCFLPHSFYFCHVVSLSLSLSL